MFKSVDFRSEFLLRQSATIDGRRYIFLSLLFLADHTFFIYTSQAGTKRLSPQSNREFLQEGLNLAGGNLPAAKLNVDGVEIPFRSMVSYPAGHAAIAELADRYQSMLPRLCPDICWHLAIGDPIFPVPPLHSIKETVLTLKKPSEEIYIGESFQLRENRSYPYRLPGEAAPYKFRIHNILQQNGTTALIYTAGAGHHLNFYDRAYLDEPLTSQSDNYAFLLPEELRQGKRVCICQPPHIAAAQGQVYELFSVTRPGQERAYSLI